MCFLSPYLREFKQKDSNLLYQIARPLLKPIVDQTFEHKNPALIVVVP